jgi:hypothetical protein
MVGCCRVVLCASFLFGALQTKCSDLSEPLEQWNGHFDKMAKSEDKRSSFVGQRCRRAKLKEGVELLDQINIRKP